MWEEGVRIYDISEVLNNFPYLRGFPIWDEELRGSKIPLYSTLKNGQNLRKTW